VPTLCSNPSQQSEFNQLKNWKKWDNGEITDIQGSTFHTLFVYQGTDDCWANPDIKHYF